MTVLQLAKLKPNDQKGQLLAPYLAKKTPRKVWNPGSYPHAHYCLTTHEKRKQNPDGPFRRYRQPGLSRNIWTLASARFTNATSGLDHELSCADVFVGMFPYLEAGRIKTWLDRWTTSQYKDFEIARHQVFFDRAMLLDGHIFFWEIDRGTENIVNPNKQAADFDKEYFAKTLNWKIEKYIAFSNAHYQTKFTVLITVEVTDKDTYRYDKEGTEQRIVDILNVLRHYNRGDQFVVAKHRHVVGDKEAVPGEVHNDLFTDPLGAHFRSPVNPATKQSLTAFIRKEQATSTS